ncbi:pectate lyase-like protein [Planomicrobium soli]|uniref:Pectate lyase-like protein n=1 Tax=Planomicrobium soli TaxID=1176648 RepID=A0A2P8H3G8_9BACL|nr:right-handed parallel beta-helix repeat-containing protein [Planomicrobium soli]PSL40774.1 pectate lyase-like protein [Planomicrobium soli]
MVVRSNIGKTALELRSKEDLIREMWIPKKTSDQIFNVKSYGARGDGKADDRKALQEAIDAVYRTSKGGNLFFPPGLYRISGPLEVPEVKDGSPVAWLGHSPDSTIIAPSQPMDYLVRMRGSGGAVKGIKFIGSDPENGYVQYAKVCMLATDIHDKIFSNSVFEWALIHGLQITGEGNNNLCVFERLCQFSQNGTVAKGRGGSGSGSKVSFLAFNPKESGVYVGAYLKVGSGEGSVYHIDEVGTNSIKVSPDLKRPLSVGTEYAIHIGCGLHTDRGSDNNVYGIYDCHFVGNKGAGLMVRGLYGHHIQGGNFDSNGITGIHIGSGSIDTTPAYSNSITHAYFENNGYANAILDYPSGLTILEPLLAKPVDGVGEGIASLTSLRENYFDYSTVSVIHNGQLYQYIGEEPESASFSRDQEPRITVNRKSGDTNPIRFELPAAPSHKFGEVLEMYVEDSAGQPVQIVCDSADVNNKDGKKGVEAPAGAGYKIVAFYSRNKKSWMVSYTNPIL